MRQGSDARDSECHNRPCIITNSTLGVILVIRQAQCSFALCAKVRCVSTEEEGVPVSSVAASLIRLHDGSGGQAIEGGEVREIRSKLMLRPADF